MISPNDNYKHLKEGALAIDDGRNRIYYCELKQYYSENVFRNFSIKYTVEGAAHYHTNNEQYRLLPNYFLLSSKQPCKGIVDSKTVTRNISIDISQDTMAEIFTVLSSQGNIDLENLQAEHFFSPDFFENIYPADNCPLGILLSSLAHSLIKQRNSAVMISDEVFFELGEKTVIHEFGNVKSLDKLDAIKASTKKETLKRLLRGKYFIDENFLSNAEIPEIARFANLSKYYFFRTFKKAFGITPYQHMLNKRLEYSKVLLQNNPVKQVAAECCFPDLFTFSKAFKRVYGYPPSFFAREYGKQDVNTAA